MEFLHSSSSPEDLLCASQSPGARSEQVAQSSQCPLRAELPHPQEPVQPHSPLPGPGLVLGWCPCRTPTVPPADLTASGSKGVRGGAASPPAASPCLLAPLPWGPHPGQGLTCLLTLQMPPQLDPSLRDCFFFFT